MSAAPSEPEKYSIDEMMERLKGGSQPSGPEQGELITRPDGTQVIKVRKRKRRSKQPHKDEAVRSRRMKVIQVSLLLVLLFVSVLGIGGALVFSNSSLFIDALRDKISRATGAEAKVTSFRMNPKTANAGSLELAWPQGNVLDTLTLHGLTAEVFPTSFLGKTFRGNEMVVNQSILTLRSPVPGEPTRTVPPASADAGLIQFARYQTPNFQISAGTSGSPVFLLEKSEASVAFKTTGANAQVKLYKGNLSLAGWPPGLRMDRALFAFQDRECRILQMRVLHPKDDRGQIDVSGIVNPFQSGVPSKLLVNLESFELDGLLGAPLGRLISGRISSQPSADSNFLTFAADGSSPLALESSFVSASESAITLQGFPFLAHLSLLLEDEWFRRPSFESDASGSFRREGGSITLGNLLLLNKGRMAIKGDLADKPDGTLSGTLRLGLTDAMILTAKAPALERLFGSAEDGYRWVELKISGTTTTPIDNFKALLATAESPTSGSSESREARPPTFEELTRPR